MSFLGSPPTASPPPCVSATQIRKALNKQHHWGGGYEDNFLRSVIFHIFQHHQNRSWLLNITFIFGRCRHSSAAVTPVKYECDSNNLVGTFARSKILLTEKLTNRALATPTPGPLVADPNYICPHVKACLCPATADQWLKWMSKAPSLMWRPLSALWVTCYAPVVAMTVPLPSDAVWSGESSGNYCLSSPPGTSFLRYLATCTRPVSTWLCSTVVKHWDQTPLS